MTIRDDVILLLLLVLVVKSAAKTHIYYSIYRCCSIHAIVYSKWGRERRERVSVLFCPFRKKTLPFFHKFS